MRSGCLASLLAIFLLGLLITSLSPLLLLTALTASLLVASLHRNLGKKFKRMLIGFSAMMMIMLMASNAICAETITVTTTLWRDITITPIVTKTLGISTTTTIFVPKTTYVTAGRTAERRTGFVVTRDGYGFQNWDWSEQSFEEMKRDIEQQFWYLVQHDRHLAPIMTLLYLAAQQGGHCYGMASTSILYYLNQINRPSGVGDTPVYSWSRPVAQPAIEYYHARQIDRMAEKFGKSVEWGLSGFDARKEFEVVKRSIDGGRPIMIILGYADGSFPHAVTAIGYDQSSNTIVLYDNNHPGEELTAKITGSSFSYKRYDRFFATSPSAQWADPNVFKGYLDRVYQSMSDLLSRTRKTLIAIDCPASLIVTDQSGKRAGYVNGVYVNEIPGCQIDSGIGLQIFYLPSDLTCQMRVEAFGDGSFNMALMSGKETVSYLDQPINKQTKCYVEYSAVSPGTSMKIDQKGDGSVDRIIEGHVTRTPPEQSSALQLLALSTVGGMTACLLVIVMVRRSPKRKRGVNARSVSGKSCPTCHHLARLNHRDGKWYCSHCRRRIR